MPLPAVGTPWPPEGTAGILDQLRIFGAWYGGQTKDLEAVYQGRNLARYDRPSQYSGGLIGLGARMLWGRPNGANGQDAVKLHVPVAGDLASMSADLIFGEDPEITVRATAGATSQKRLEAHIDGGLWTRFREAAEGQAAIGGTFLRAVWDTDVADKPWLQQMSSEDALPDFSFGRLTAVTFFETLSVVGQVVVRHLERHEPGIIRHAVYEGTLTTLGRVVPLADYPQTERLASMINTDGDGIATGVPMLTAVYVPNVLPNPMWRDNPMGKYLGRSDYSGIEPLMDALDETYTSWMRDVRLGMARLIVNQTALISAGTGQGALLDTDRELLVGLNLSPGADQGDPITQVQFKIRYAEHQATAKDLTQQIVTLAGYSFSSFSEAESGASSRATATEIKAREKRTLSTRKKKIGYWTQGIKEAVPMLLALDAFVYGATAKPGIPTVDFPDAVTEDPEAVARTLQTLHDAQVASQEVLVKMLHPDWDDTQVAEEITRIKADQPAPAPAPRVNAPDGAKIISDQPSDAQEAT